MVTSKHFRILGYEAVPHNDKIMAIKLLVYAQHTNSVVNINLSQSFTDISVVMHHLAIAI